MNKPQNNTQKEYKIDMMSVYPQTFLDGSKISVGSAGNQNNFGSSTCQNCMTGGCANCQNNTYTNPPDGQMFAGQPNFQDLLPLLLKSLGGKGDVSSLMPLISKFSQNSPQDGASVIQNLLNIMPKMQNKNNEQSAKNTTTTSATSNEGSPSETRGSQIDKLEIIKDL